MCYQQSMEHSSYQETAEDPKNCLVQFSPQLRRDFLAILVKMAAREFKMITVRNDWRTRDGMLKFIEKIWPKLRNVLFEDNAIFWFVSIYRYTENAFSNRHFAIFLYDNWQKYKDILKNQETINFLRYNQKHIKEVLKLGQKASMPFQWQNYPIAIILFQIIQEFTNKTQSPMFLSDSDSEKDPRLATTEDVIQSNEIYNVDDFEPHFDPYDLNLPEEIIYDPFI